MDKVRGYFFYLLIGYAIIFCTFLITSAIFAYTNIEDSYLNIAIYICLGISTLISSFLLGKKIKEKGLTVGGIFGLLFYGLIFLSSGIVSGFTFSISVLIYFGISILSSILGAIFGVNF